MKKVCCCFLVFSLFNLFYFPHARSKKHIYLVSVENKGNNIRSVKSKVGGKDYQDNEIASTEKTVIDFENEEKEDKEKEELKKFSDGSLRSNGEVVVGAASHFSDPNSCYLYKNEEQEAFAYVDTVEKLVNITCSTGCLTITQLS